MRGWHEAKGSHDNQESYKRAWDMNARIGHEMTSEGSKATIVTSTASSSMGPPSCKIKRIGTEN